jgi:2-polyprenyl-6-methoxyphenol hydroxylase-like FAD-dependent oxidoreductase
MARAEYSVVMIEITEAHRDVVRGEWLAPWGVLDAKQLGLYELYRSHQAHHITHHVGYDEHLPIEVAESMPLDFSALVPGSGGALAIGHPRLCGILNDAAVAAGAKFLRGVRKTRVTPGVVPTVSFEHQDTSYQLKPRLVIAADGRHGKTIQQAGIHHEADPVHHWFSGMLVEGADGWPADKQTVGVANNVNFFVFPQGNGKARLYLGAALDDKERFMGEGAQARFVESFRLACVPQSEAIANARPASHCFVYPNNDTWCDEPYVPGVVAIGDAAGHNDPIIGQGLSITHRDVRVVSEILQSTNEWGVEAFRSYGAARKELLRRLRLSARYMAVRDCEFGERAQARRMRLAQQTLADPLLMGLLVATIAGPDNVPAEAFDAARVEAALAA